VFDIGAFVVVVVTAVLMGFFLFVVRLFFCGSCSVEHWWTSSVVCSDQFVCHAQMDR